MEKKKKKLKKIISWKLHNMQGISNSRLLHLIKRTVFTCWLCNQYESVEIKGRQNLQHIKSINGLLAWKKVYSALRRHSGWMTVHYLLASFNKKNEKLLHTCKCKYFYFGKRLKGPYLACSLIKPKCKYQNLFK